MKINIHVNLKNYIQFNAQIRIKFHAQTTLLYSLCVMLVCTELDAHAMLRIGQLAKFPTLPALQAAASRAGQAYLQHPPARHNIPLIAKHFHNHAPQFYTVCDSNKKIFKTDDQKNKHIQVSPINQTDQVNQSGEQTDAAFVNWFNTRTHKSEKTTSEELKKIEHEILALIDEHAKQPYGYYAALIQEKNQHSRDFFSLITLSQCRSAKKDTHKTDLPCHTTEIEFESAIFSLLCHRAIDEQYCEENIMGSSQTDGQSIVQYHQLIHELMHLAVQREYILLRRDQAKLKDFKLDKDLSTLMKPGLVSTLKQKFKKKKDELQIMEHNVWSFNKTAKYY